MRLKRYLVVATAAMVTAGGGFHAFADPATPSPAADSPGGSHAVRLPTGDVAVLSGTSFMWLPAEGREDVGVLRPPALDGSGDVIAIPSDVVAEVASGEQDPRRYNLSELVRAGETDAAKATTLSTKPYGVLAPAGDEPDADAADPAVTVTATDAEGKPAPATTGLYVDTASGEAAELRFDTSGTATVSVPPGTYHFITNAGTVLGGKTVEVAEDNVEMTMDGTESQLIEYHLDQPADVATETVDIISFGNGAGPVWLGVGGDADGRPRVIPTAETDTGIGFEAKPQLTGGQGDETYRYDLDFLHKDGIPQAPEFTAEDEELAEVTRRFDGIASEAGTRSCSSAVHEEGSQLGMCASTETPIPGEYIRYKTADPKLEWTHYTSFVVSSGGEPDMIAFVGADRFEPGPVERVSAMAPLGLHMAMDGVDVVQREGDQITVNARYLNNGSDEGILSGQESVGTARMTKDGEEVGKGDLRDGHGRFQLPDNDSGHYTLEVDVSHGGKVTPLTTTNTMVWEFDSESTDQATSLPVSAVHVTPAGVSNGYAEAGAEQDFTFDFVAQEGAPDTDLTGFAYEVSYDDGKTWQDVDVTVDGDSGSGTMKHPGDATFVSIRTTATDDDGNKVTQTTLRVMALR